MDFYIIHNYIYVIHSLFALYKRSLLAQYDDDTSIIN